MVVVFHQEKGKTGGERRGWVLASDIMVWMRSTCARLMMVIVVHIRSREREMGRGGYPARA